LARIVPKNLIIFFNLIKLVEIIIFIGLFIKISNIHNFIIYNSKVQAY